MLNHISKWDSKHGWIHTTANEAHKDHPFGLTSHSIQYLCETCGQYVTLKISNKGTPFFWHPVGSKDCDDKLTSYGLYRKVNPLGFSLPLRIAVKQCALEVFIGFLPLPSSKLEAAEKNNIVLRIENKQGKNVSNYAISSERFSDEHLTYLSIGSGVSELYFLNYSNGINKFYWPQVVDGIEKSGTLFDCHSGKRLPRNANTLVGGKYWLLAQKKIPYHKDILISLEKTIGQWKLYCVQATALSREAADFLLQYGARLTDEFSEITHIWPPAIRSSHFLTHCAKKIWFYKTDGFVDIYPLRKHYKYNSGLFALAKNQMEQILTLSRFENQTSVLKHMLVRYMPYMKQNKNHGHLISITDVNNNPVGSGKHTNLPSGRILNITTKFDGFIMIKQKGFECERLYFKGNEKTSVEVKFSQFLTIYQGLDCVAEISFVRSTINDQDDDQVFVLTLSRCSGPMVNGAHTLGALTNEMKNMPKTKRWLRDQLRVGTIRRDAVMMLTKRFRRV